MGKLFRHKPKPRQEKRAFSKNTTKTVYEYKDGSKRVQSHLSGKYQTVNKKGKVIKNY